MAWNEPGNDNKDPWSGKQKPNGPPDLEAMLQEFRKKIRQLLGKKSVTNKNGSNQESEKITGFGIWLVAIFLFVVWALWGIFIVGPAEKAVVLRFGKYVETVGPGPHWIPPLINTVYKVNDQNISTYSYNAEMLTKDQNIVSVAVAVQYRVADPKNYLFGVVKPHESLQQATASALRQVIGRTNLDQVLTSGREQIRQQVQSQITNILSRYKTGFVITDVAIQPAKAPDEVKEAFDDAIKAQEDEQRFENQAQAYAMQVVPTAKGQAQRLIADANGYQKQVVLRAQAEVAPFLALLPEYQRNSTIVRERLYLETLQNIFSNTPKLLVDTNGNNNMIYLPLDKLTAKPTTIAAAETPATPASTPAPSVASEQTPTAPSETQAEGY